LLRHFVALPRHSNVHGCAVAAARRHFLPNERRTQLSLQLHIPRREAAARLEAGRRGGAVGGEGRRHPRQEIEEDERRIGGVGAGSLLPGTPFQMRHHSSIPRRPVASLASEGSSSRDLLPSLALARPSIPPRIKTSRMLRVPVFRQTQGRLHQPLSLQANRDARPAARFSPQIYRTAICALHASTAVSTSPRTHIPTERLLSTQLRRLGRFPGRSFRLPRQRPFRAHRRQLTGTRFAL